MSQEESLSIPHKVYRTVTPRTGMRPDMEMDSIGWAMFLILVMLFIPLLPFIAIVYVVSKVFGYLSNQRGTGE
ncbi:MULTISPECIES: hypothetical protein [Haloferax]|uniref:Uncharacterized protein n=1 Tax=Haloferax marinum TaxID=2666143 RepID=A0A6A8G7U7_9EURY|nr:MULTISPECIES: hypothetical protein [Haloferax]KAB1197311.1 hypothetical protein Hfx1150_07215 [Haloferax sp. CBA1150]MRW96353.1 hypothetical protein [Haloferax marinum]